MITHFASMGGNSCNYSYAIYTLLIKLREAFNINQKVELVEETLRKFFYYWLDLCSRKMKENVIYDGNVIVVLEGIENFYDPETKSESSLKFWLPKNLPENVRFIVTASPDSKSAEALRDMGSAVIPILTERSVIRSWMDSVKTKPKNELLVEEGIVRKLVQLVDNKLDNGQVKMIYVKALMSLLAPKVYVGIEDEAQERQLLSSTLNKLDWKALESNILSHRAYWRARITQVRHRILRGQTITSERTTRAVVSYLYIS